MVGQAWWPDAQRDGRDWACYGMAGNTNSRRVAVHSTENQVGTPPRNVADYMWSNAGSGTGYHVLLPLTEAHRPLQLRPGGCGAGSLRNTGDNPGGISPNKTGEVLIQVSIVGYARDAHCAHGLGPWWPSFLEWVDGWGVPERWVWRDWSDGARMPKGTYWGGSSGWTAHQQIPTQTHTDPGRVTEAVLWSGAGSGPPPGGGGHIQIDVEHGGSVSLQYLEVVSPYLVSRDVRSVQFLVESHRIDGLGVGELAKDSSYGPKTEQAVRTFQQAKGLTADGIVGRNTWQRLLSG